MIELNSIQARGWYHIANGNSQSNEDVGDKFFTRDHFGKVSQVSKFSAPNIRILFNPTSHIAAMLSVFACSPRLIALGWRKIIQV